MKKTLIFLLLPFLLLSCSKNKTATETAQNYLQSQLKYPESFKVEQISVDLDTIPFYLNVKILSAVEYLHATIYEIRRYMKLGYQYQDEINKSIDDFAAAQLALDSVCNQEKQNDLLIHYVALVKYSAANDMGETISNRAIVIVDKDNPKKVLGQFSVDDDFITQIKCIKNGEDEIFDLKRNQFGKLETEGLPRIEQFLFSE